MILSDRSLILPAVLTLGLLGRASSMAQAPHPVEQIRPVNFSDVVITDAFWSPRIDKVSTATLRACIDYTENKTGRIRNFEKAARRKGEKHEGVYYDDSDVYKALEAIAYCLRSHPDTALRRKADEWIDKIAAAQLPDGYLNTYYTLTGLQNRWTDMEKHEDYCAGHLIEAGIAYHDATGDRRLLDVAIRFADHIDSVFRRADRHWVSGHEEIELALMKLYHHTGDARYMQLAQWFLDQRGHGYGKGVIWDQWKDPDYCQDKVPVDEQDHITGHAVRAMYLYTGMADVAAVTGSTGYMAAMRRVWDDVVGRNLYLTGGIGAEAQNEGFGAPYDLPNETAYCETCASVGMVLWNSRMNLLTGDAKYVDVLERSLYNGALDGLSLSGDRFFYGNPLASRGGRNRKEWFGTACCPSNIARLVSSLGNYIYGTTDKGILVNLYIGSHSTFKVDRKEVGLRLETGYPWNGRVKITVDATAKQSFPLSLRLPGWMETPAPGGLYSYADTAKSEVRVMVNGKPAAYKLDKGYAVIDRVWKKGDVVGLELPMEVRKVVSRKEVRQDSGRVALQYGPLVYCVETADNGDDVWKTIVPPDTHFETNFDAARLGGINTIRFDAKVAVVSGGGRTLSSADKKITAIPYYAWCNRGGDAMQIWLPQSFAQLLP